MFRGDSLSHPFHKSSNKKRKIFFFYFYFLFVVMLNFFLGHAQTKKKTKLKKIEPPPPKKMANQSTIWQLMDGFAKLCSKLRDIAPMLSDSIDVADSKFRILTSVYTDSKKRAVPHTAFVRARQLLIDFEKHIKQQFKEVDEHVLRKVVRRKLVMFNLKFLRPHIVRKTKRNKSRIAITQLNYDISNKETARPVELRCCIDDSAFLTCHFFHVEHCDTTLQRNLFADDLQDADTIVNTLQVHLESMQVHVTRNMDTPHKDDCKNTLTLVFVSQLLNSLHMRTKCSYDIWNNRFLALKKKCKACPQSVRIVQLCDNDFISNEPTFLSNIQRITLFNMSYVEVLEQIKRLC